MSSTKFMAIVPQTIQPGDKVRIKGKVKADAEQFSINFVNQTCNTDNVTYHFKWFLKDEFIVENYKEKGEWMEEKETKYNALEGPTFALEFAFQDDGIYVYMCYGEGRNLITQYEPQIEISNIESVQVWGDYEKINEITFAYQ